MQSILWGSLFYNRSDAIYNRSDWDWPVVVSASYAGVYPWYYALDLWEMDC